MRSTIQPIYPLVSVVLATYNGEKYLRQQLDSILQQDYPNIEIVVTDDCSSDSTLTILQEYASKYPSILIYANDTNLGLNKNFEKGMLLAQGEYIAISDQDDIWKKEKITTLMNKIGNHAIIYHDSELIDLNGLSLNRKLSDIKQLGDFDNCLNVAIVANVPGHAMLFKKSLVDQCIPFPENAILYDHWMAFVATFSTGIKFISRPLVMYRQHENNIYGTGLVKKKKRKKYALSKNQRAKNRLRLFYNKCPSTLIKQKKVLGDLMKSYTDFSIGNDFARMILFFNNSDTLLASKKRSRIRKWLFCLKTFVQMP